MNKRVFYLRTPEQLFLKFYSDLEKLKDSLNQKAYDPRGYETAAYHAFNAAITVWHLTDWTWNSLNEEEKKQLSKFFNVETHVENLQNFQWHIRNKCIALAICWEVANGSKHFSTHESSKVDAKMEVKTKPATAGEFRAGYPLQTLTYDFIVDYNNESLRMVDVFIEARNFWHDFLAQFKLTKEILVDVKFDITITRDSKFDDKS